MRDTFFSDDTKSIPTHVPGSAVALLVAVFIDIAAFVIIDNVVKDGNISRAVSEITGLDYSFVKWRCL